MTNPTTEQLEERLTAAFGARASLVTADVLSPLPIPTHRSGVRRRVTIAVTAVAAAALVVVGAAAGRVLPWQDKDGQVTAAEPDESAAGVRDLGGGKWEAFGVTLQLPLTWSMVDERAATGIREVCVIAGDTTNSCVMQLLVARVPGRALTEGVNLPMDVIERLCDRPREMQLKAIHSQVNGRAATQFVADCRPGGETNTAWALDNATVALVPLHGAGGEANATAASMFASIVVPASWPTEPAAVASAAPEPASTEVPASTAPPSSPPALSPAPVSADPAQCEGLPAGFAGMKELGVVGATQETIAESFATVVLGAKPQTLKRIDACTVVLQPSGTRLIFAAPGPNGAVLSYANSFGDQDGGLGLGVDSGHVSANTGHTCAGCVRIEARLVAKQGASVPRTFAVNQPIDFSTPATWTERALLLRFLGKNGAVKGVLFIPFSDGKFSAG